MEIWLKLLQVSTWVKIAWAVSKELNAVFKTTVIGSSFSDP